MILRQVKKFGFIFALLIILISSNSNAQGTPKNKTVKVGKTYCSELDINLFRQAGSETVGKGSHYVHPNPEELFISEYVNPKIAAGLFNGRVLTKIEDLNCYFPENKYFQTCRATLIFSEYDLEVKNIVR